MRRAGARTLDVDNGAVTGVDGGLGLAGIRADRPLRLRASNGGRSTAVREDAVDVEIRAGAESGIGRAESVAVRIELDPRLVPRPERILVHHGRGVGGEIDGLRRTGRASLAQRHPGHRRVDAVVLSYHRLALWYSGDFPRQVI